MFGFKKPQPKTVELVRTVVVHTETPQAVEVRARQEKFTEAATNEYCRLAVRANQELTAKEAGRGHSQFHLDQALAQMHVLSQSIAVVSGEDHILCAVRLERLARSRRGDNFPLNSYLGAGGPQWPISH